MIGFFEHQYLSYKKNHIKNLLALARADDHMHKKEINLLHRIGKKYGLKKWQMEELMASKEKFEINVPDNFNDRMNLLYDLILMVYADQKVEKQEIAFCQDVAKRFGLKKEIVEWLLEEFENGTPPPADQWDDMKKEAQQRFVIKKKS
jgi:uncharacterized tellurite resistance protein B-like protein